MIAVTLVADHEERHCLCYNLAGRSILEDLYQLVFENEPRPFFELH